MGTLRHTATGWWLEQAVPVQATRPLAGDTSADVVVVGGGYLGMWTAWQLTKLESGIDVVVLDASVCGHGPSGRNGGFCETLWSNLPSLRERFGDERAVAAAEASSESVRAIGAWCRQAGFMMVSTDSSQDDVVERIMAASDGEHLVPLDAAAVRARCDTP